MIVGRESVKMQQFDLRIHLFVYRYLLGLENRIDGLERSLQSVKSTGRAEDNQSSWLETGNHNTDGTSTLLDIDAGEDEEGVDALGTVVFADEVESGFYGAPSLHCLARENELKLYCRSVFKHRTASSGFARCLWCQCSPVLLP